MTVETPLQPSRRLLQLTVCSTAVALLTAAQEAHAYGLSCTGMKAYEMSKCLKAKRAAEVCSLHL